MEHEDIYGRIESFDQSVRSLNKRLRAVERRLSIDKNNPNLITSEINGEAQLNGIDIEQIQTEIQEFRNTLNGVTEDLSIMKSGIVTTVKEFVSPLAHDLKDTQKKIDELIKQQTAAEAESTASINSIGSAISETATLKKELMDITKRLKRQENSNKIIVGSVKVPVELSGLVASIVLIVTGCLIWANKWDIIRSTYYSAALAVLFAVTVAAKFIMTNRDTDS
jgi:chromosome segregation ATPase